MRTRPNHPAIITFLSTVLCFAMSVDIPIKAAAGQTSARPYQAPPLQVPSDTPAPGNPVVDISTSLGDITLELFKDRAPVSVENFLAYVGERFTRGRCFTA
jgi:hypothetical protein